MRLYWPISPQDTCLSILLRAYVALVSTLKLQPAGTSNFLHFCKATLRPFLVLGCIPFLPLFNHFLHSSHTHCYKTSLCSFALRQLCRKCVLWRHPPTGEHM